MIVVWQNLTNCPLFQVPRFLALLWNLCIRIFGVLHLLSQGMTLDTMSFLLMIL
jgi:hypothetical protein